MDKVYCEAHRVHLLDLIGNTRMELGSYAKPMFDDVIRGFSKTNFTRWGVEKDSKRFFVDGGKWDVLLNLMEQVKPFENMLRQCKPTSPIE